MGDLNELLEKGAEPRTTELTESFDLAAYREKYPQRLILFVTSASGKVIFPIKVDDVSAPAGSNVTALSIRSNEEVAN